ncbi:MAG: DUF4248 domain-containing protein [Bacteroidales bacterium]|nr:DUF4248 domain-containing protein [Candidatus Minthousia equi]
MENIIRSYSIGEMANLYFPNAKSNDAARRNLRRWISQNAILRKEVLNISGSHHYTPQQVKLIFEVLGPP